MTTGMAERHKIVPSAHRGRLFGLSFNLIMAAVMFVGLVLSFAIYVRSEKMIDSANSARTDSFLLADELRQSSDDLTRMARTYVVTGKELYSQAFHSIIKIRNGDTPRPPQYNYMYWDLVMAGELPLPPTGGTGVSLLDQILRTGVTGDELAKLVEAKTRSDALAAQEMEAIRLIRNGGPAEREQARAIMYGDEYYQAKAAVMHPIAEFMILQDKRTLDGVREAVEEAVILRTVFICFIGGALLFLWRTYRETRGILGGSADQVHAEITKIGQGDFSSAITAPPGMEDSVLAGLSRMREKLALLEAGRQRAEDATRLKNDALERSNSELETYAYVASHDLREPLRNLSAFSTLLARRLEGRLSAEEQDFLKIITDAAFRMNTLVLDLLEVSRVGRTEQSMQKVPLAQVVQAAIGSLRARLDDCGAEITVPDELPVILGNEEELYRFFLNIIGNSLKYRGTDCPRVTISCQPEEPDAWRIRIQDNGIGIEPGHGYEERIFGLFQRLHQRDEYGGGTGIGLPICRKIINRHGGRLWAQSEGLGKGTAFVFTLPRAPDESGANAPS